MTNATSCATGRVPFATWNAPSPRTTARQSCITTPESGVTADETRAKRIPACFAASMVRSTREIAQSAAFRDRIVLDAKMLWSRDEPSDDTPSWTWVDALRSRPDRAMTHTNPIVTVTTVASSRRGLTKAMAISAPTNMITPPMIWPAPSVSATRSRVVSDVALATRSARR